MKHSGLIALVAATLFAAPAMAQAPTQTGPRVSTDLINNASASVKTETGVIDGASFRIDMPANWNHGLIIMNHGYSPEPRKPADGPPTNRITLFTDRGFAVAQSSYSKGGWAIEEAMTDNEKLRKYFVKKYGKTNTVIATGGAMGASVTVASVENHPEIYDAGLVTCCSGLDPRLENMNVNFELLALFDYYFPGVLPPVVGPLNGYAYSIGKSPTSDKIQKALDANPEKAEIFRKAWGRKKEDVATTVAFHTYLIHEAQERSGGNPFTNVTTLYQVDDDLTKVNSGVQRHAADPGKDAYLKKWYTATGRTTKPLMILEPIYDPIVPVQTTEAYVALAKRAGSENKVAFQFFDHYGHGSVTTPEVTAAFDDLLKWMKGGPKPMSGHGVNRADPNARRPAAAAG